MKEENPEKGSKQHVLLCNDDGVFSDGIQALEYAFLAAGWRVTVCAPDRNRSTISHSVSFTPIEAACVDRREMIDSDDLAVWKTNGTPADCVKLALLKLLPQKPDIVVSGINNGWNVGMACHHSGTVSAAMESIFFSVPSIAVSCPINVGNYNATARLAVRVAQCILENDISQGIMWNINLPECDQDEIKGLVEAPMARTSLVQFYETLNDNQSANMYLLHEDLNNGPCEEGSDLFWLRKHYATVSAFRWDWTVQDRSSFIIRDISL